MAVYRKETPDQVQYVVASSSHEIDAATGAQRIEVEEIEPHQLQGHLYLFGLTERKNYIRRARNKQGWSCFRFHEPVEEYAGQVVHRADEKVAMFDEGAKLIRSDNVEAAIAHFLNEMAQKNGS